MLGKLLELSSSLDRLEGRSLVLSIAHICTNLMRRKTISGIETLLIGRVTCCFDVRFRSGDARTIFGAPP